uniref:SH3 domain-containing protein n=1 Tax=Comamonas halotolerans TaxID=3041496 RepID=UPI0024E12E19
SSSKSHQSEFPNPIYFKTGDRFLVGEMYKGPEPWDNWYLCTALGQEPGWVPMQVISIQSDGKGIATMDYAALELDVSEGETVTGRQKMNGWVWCTSVKTNRDGWVPEENLLAINE